MRQPIIPLGSWPRRLNATLAAQYVGESNAAAFSALVGTRYPRPRVDEPTRQLWLRDDLDYILLEQSDAEVAEFLVAKYKRGSFGKREAHG